MAIFWTDDFGADQGNSENTATSEAAGVKAHRRESPCGDRPRDLLPWPKMLARLRTVMAQAVPGQKEER